MAYKSGANGPSYFDGGVLQLTGYSILAALLTFVTFGIAFPWALCMLKRWETRHTVIQHRRLEFDGRGLQLLGLWIVLALLPIGVLIAAVVLVLLGGGTPLSGFVLFCVSVAAIFYGPFVDVQIKKWVVSHTHLDPNGAGASPSAAPPARPPLALTSKDLVRADGMIAYCDYFDFSNGVDADCRGRLFRAAEAYVPPDTEVVMAFAAALDGTAGNSCVCVFGATRFIIAAEGSVDVIPVEDITGFSLEDKGLLSVITMSLRGSAYRFGVRDVRAAALLRTCRSSLADCQAEINQMTTK